MGPDCFGKDKMKTGFLVQMLVLGGLVFCGLNKAALAHKGATGIVKQRMDAMRVLKNEVKIIDDMLAGKKYLSFKRLQHVLSKIKANSGAAMLKLFPEGSHEKPSEADPVIWKSWADFTAVAGDLETMTGQFADSIKTKPTKDVVKANYLKLRATCKTCHDRFRE